MRFHRASIWNTNGFARNDYAVDTGHIEVLMAKNTMDRILGNTGNTM
jgi:hypothetical protein